MKNKKILIFTNHFLPGNRAGGPVTSIANLSQLLDNDFKIIIVTSNRDLGIDIPYDKIEYDKVVKHEKFNVIYLSTINTNTVFNTIVDNEPDLIYLNSFFSIFTQFVLFLSIKNKLKTPILLAPRGELQENALAIKAFKKKIYLSVYKLMKMYKRVSFHATDIIEADRIKKIFAVEDVTIVPNVPKVSNTNALTKEKNCLKLIFISRIRDNKNLLFALEVLKRVDGDIVFDIYGPIEDEAYWNKCQLMMYALPSNITSTYKGVVSPSDIANVMRQYHALLLPTKTENFGHIIVESMQSGLIPIISDQTPWIELKEHQAGWSLPLNDKESFIQAINLLFTMDKEEYVPLSSSTIAFISEKLNVEEMKYKYVNMLENALALRN